MRYSLCFARIPELQSEPRLFLSFLPSVSNISLDSGRAELFLPCEFRNKPVALGLGRARTLEVDGRS